MKARRLTITVFAAGTSLIALVAMWRVNQQQANHLPAVIKPAVVRCTTLVPQQHAKTERFYGLIEANMWVEMAFQITGRIMQLGPSKEESLQEDDWVERHQIVAKLDPARYEAVLDQTKGQMDQAKAGLASNEALVHRAKTQYEDVEREVKRLGKLQKSGSATERELERAELGLRMAEAELDRAKAQLMGANAKYVTTAATASLARVNLDDATLKAPLAARVASIPVEIGQMVQAGQAVLTLVDLSKVKLVVGVVERKLPVLRRGQKVQVQVEALSAHAQLLAGNDLGEPRQGVISVVPPAADPVTGLFNVEISLPNGEGLLRPGMIGKATVTLVEQTAFAVPAEAVQRTGQQIWAYFLDQGYPVGLELGSLGSSRLTAPTPVARRVQLEPVAADKDEYLLTHLPERFRKLIVEGHSRLTDGQPVIVVDSLADAATTSEFH